MKAQVDKLINNQPKGDWSGRATRAEAEGIQPLESRVWLAHYTHEQNLLRQRVIIPLKADPDDLLRHLLRRRVPNPSKAGRIFTTILRKMDKVRACHRHHRAPRIVFVGISPTAGRISCRGGGWKSLEGTLVSHVGRYLAPPPARMA